MCCRDDQISSVTGILESNSVRSARADALLPSGRVINCAEILESRRDKQEGVEVGDTGQPWVATTVAFVDSQ